MGSFLTAGEGTPVGKGGRQTGNRVSRYTGRGAERVAYMRSTHGECGSAREAALQPPLRTCDVGRASLMPREDPTTLVRALRPVLSAVPDAGDGSLPTRCGGQC